MTTSPSTDKPLNPRVCRSAERLIEYYLDAEEDSAERHAKVKSFYANDELLAAVTLIANPSDPSD